MTMKIHETSKLCTCTKWLLYSIEKLLGSNQLTGHGNLPEMTENGHWAPNHNIFQKYSVAMVDSTGKGENQDVSEKKRVGGKVRNVERKTKTVKDFVK